SLGSNARLVHNRLFPGRRAAATSRTCTRHSRSTPARGDYAQVWTPSTNHLKRTKTTESLLKKTRNPKTKSVTDVLTQMCYRCLSRSGLTDHGLRITVYGLRITDHGLCSLW